jgi:hypothetical protein
MSGFEEDPSASTARFRAFTEHPEVDNRPAWGMGAPRSRVLLFAVGVVVLAILVGAVAMSLAG